MNSFYRHFIRLNYKSIKAIYNNRNLYSSYGIQQITYNEESDTYWVRFVEGNHMLIER